MAPPGRWRWSGASGIGGRARNEDCWGACRAGGTVIAVVADGLGGHSDGDRASRVAVHAALDAVGKDPGFDPERLARSCAEAAGAAVLAERARRGNDMGTTIVALALAGGRAGWAWSGDSRAYALPGGGGRPVRLTTDHTLAMARLPEAARAEADVRTNPDRNILVSSLGHSDQLIDSAACAIAAGDGFALCSDGYWEQVAEAELFPGGEAGVDAPTMMRTIDARVPFGGDNHTLLLLASGDGGGGQWRSTGREVSR